ncbi:MAG: hypothetical protein ABSD12_21590 [Paraburkholderia sp.]
MREIRTFELDHGEPAAAWRITQALTLQVMAGEVWLTVQGDLRGVPLTEQIVTGVTAWIRSRANISSRSSKTTSTPTSRPSSPIASRPSTSSST